MMQFVSDPKFLIIFSIIEYCIKHILSFEFIYYLNFAEVDHSSIGSTTRNISDNICLNTDAHLDKLLGERNPKMYAWLSKCFLKHTKILINTNVTLSNLMEAHKHKPYIAYHKNQNYLDDTHQYIFNNYYNVIKSISIDIIQTWYQIQIKIYIMLRSLLCYRLKHNFSQLIRPKNAIIHPLTQKLKLRIKNQQTLQINIQTFNKPVVLLKVPKTATLADLTKQIQQKLGWQSSQVFYLCNQRNRLPESTPLEILTSRFFYLFLGRENPGIPVEGQLFDYGKSQEVVQGISSLQLPAVTKRQAETYFTRVSQWFQFYTGKSMLDQTAKLDTKTVSKILVEAAIDPTPQERRISQIHNQWIRVYWIVEDLRKKKRQADEICLKRVRSKMALGLVFLSANIAFIWTGTYIYFSWDIIEPLAYFTSLIGLIIITAQFFKLGRPYSNVAYQQYLMQKVSTKVYQQVGFSKQALSKAEYQLIILQSKIKDHYLKRL